MPPQPPTLSSEHAHGDGAPPDDMPARERPEDDVPLTARPLTARPLPEAEGWVAPHIRERLWWAGALLYRRRVLLVTLTVVTAVVVAGLSLLLPNRYRAETRLLLPDANGGLSSLLDTVAPGASALLGRKSGSYTRYLAILTSRTTHEDVVDRFGLVEHYDVADDRHPREAALRELGKRTTFNVSLDYDYLAVTVLDEDPARAAQMANYFVELLNERHIEMSAGSAGENRRFLETRLREAELALDSAQAAMQSFQERYGVVEMESQASALMGALSIAQGQVAQAEVRYEALRSQFGDENPEVLAARAALESARGSLGRLTGGGEAVMPVAIRRLPAVGRQYAGIFQELRTQEEIIKVVRPLYEQAVLAERREASAVQVLDPAVAPARKAEPRRALMVLSAALGVALLASLLLVLSGAWRQQRDGVMRRLQGSV